MNTVLLLARGVMLLGLAAATPSWAAPQASMPESLWHCRGADLALRMHWREVSAAEGCDGESCRLAPESVTEGVLMTERGRRIGVVAVRGDVQAGWSFRDVEGRAWQLRPHGTRLTGVVAARGKRQAVTCGLESRSIRDGAVATAQ